MEIKTLKCFYFYKLKEYSFIDVCFRYVFNGIQVSKKEEEAWQIFSE